MQRSSWDLDSLKILENLVGVKPLLKKMLFQMENCVKNIKICHFITCLSLLIAWKSVGGGEIGVLNCWTHTWGHWEKFWISFQNFEGI